MCCCYCYQGERSLSLGTSNPLSFGPFRFSFLLFYLASLYHLCTRVQFLYFLFAYRKMIARLSANSLEFLYTCNVGLNTFIYMDSCMKFFKSNCLFLLQGTCPYCLPKTVACSRSDVLLGAKWAQQPAANRINHATAKPKPIPSPSLVRDLTWQNQAPASHVSSTQVPTRLNAPTHKPVQPPTV